ncbi:21129_t:CDS:2, partial [Dentiscutata erythropus]
CFIAAKRSSTHTAPVLAASISKASDLTPRKRQNRRKSTNEQRIEQQAKKIASEGDKYYSEYDNNYEETSVNNSNLSEVGINKAKEMLPVVENSANDVVAATSPTKPASTETHVAAAASSAKPSSMETHVAAAASPAKLMYTLSTATHGAAAASPAKPMRTATTSSRVVAAAYPAPMHTDEALHTYLNEENENNHLSQTTTTKIIDTFNEFEITLWVAQHSRILNLAMMIHNAMTTQVSNNNQSFNSLLNAPEINTGQSCPEINQRTKFLLQEECKALFLRTRNNTTELYEELISQSVSKLADQFTLTHNWEIESLYSGLSTFISDDIWKETLQLHLKCTDLMALKKDSLMLNKLGIFVLKAVEAVAIAMANNEDTRIAIQDCD